MQYFKLKNNFLSDIETNISFLNQELELAKSNKRVEQIETLVNTPYKRVYTVVIRDKTSKKSFTASAQKNNEIKCPFIINETQLFNATDAALYIKKMK